MDGILLPSWPDCQTMQCICRWRIPFLNLTDCSVSKFKCVHITLCRVSLNRNLTLKKKKNRSNIQHMRRHAHMEHTKALFSQGSYLNLIDFIIHAKRDSATRASEQNCSISYSLLFFASNSFKDISSRWIQPPCSPNVWLGRQLTMFIPIYPFCPLISHPPSSRSSNDIIESDLCNCRHYTEVMMISLQYIQTLATCSHAPLVIMSPPPAFLQAATSVYH